MPIISTVPWYLRQVLYYIYQYVTQVRIACTVIIARTNTYTGKYHIYQMIFWTCVTTASTRSTTSEERQVQTRESCVRDQTNNSSLKFLFITKTVLRFRY